MTFRPNRGSALLMVLSILVVIVSLCAGLLYFVGGVRTRAVNESRRIPRNYCADTGLQLARSYFGQNYTNWNTYLKQPRSYNPIASAWNTPLLAPPEGPGPAAPVDTLAQGGFNTNLQGSFLCNNAPCACPAGGACSPLQLAHPELFADLDGDGKYDVYIYIRDDMDEMTGSEIYDFDSNLQVFVGAICISSTLTPRRQDGSIDPSAMMSEGLLTYNGAGGNYQQRGGAGSAGNNNVNGS